MFDEARPCLYKSVCRKCLNKRMEKKEKRKLSGRVYEAPFIDVWVVPRPQESRDFLGERVLP